MPDTETHRGIEIRIRRVTDGQWIAAYTLPKPGTQWHYSTTSREEVLEEACDAIDEWCLEARG